MKYLIALKKTDEGYSVSVPGLPGASRNFTPHTTLTNVRLQTQK